MPAVNLLIPIETTSRNGFYNHHDAPAKQLFGYRLDMKIHESYLYLELQGVPPKSAAAVLERVRALLPWSALRLNFGILAGTGDLTFTDEAYFDGQSPTAYYTGLDPRPIRVEGNQKTLDADTLLFSTLIEGSQLQAFSGSNPNMEFRLACEIFASVDFESSANAQFLALISILEIIAKPAPRPKQCTDIIEDAMTRMKREAQATQDAALRQALMDMYKGASHWKAESIRSSIRRLGTKVSRTLGDPDSPEAGKAAVQLYDKRSKVVHEGYAASLKDVAETRQIVREALAVEADCFHHLRERFPKN